MVERDLRARWLGPRRALHLRAALRQVPGAQVSGPIDLFDRDGASGTQDAFQNIFLGESLKISPSATPENSEGTEASAVTGDKHYLKIDGLWEDHVLTALIRED